MELNINNGIFSYENLTKKRKKNRRKSFSFKKKLIINKRIRTRMSTSTFEGTWDMESDHNVEAFMRAFFDKNKALLPPPPPVAPIQGVLIMPGASNGIQMRPSGPPPGAQPPKPPKPTIQFKRLGQGAWNYKLVTFKIFEVNLREGSPFSDGISTHA